MLEAKPCPSPTGSQPTCTDLLQEHTYIGFLTWGLLSRRRRAARDAWPTAGRADARKLEITAPNVDAAPLSGSCFEPAVDDVETRCATWSLRLGEVRALHQDRYLNGARAQGMDRRHN